MTKYVWLTLRWILTALLALLLLSGVLRGEWFSAVLLVVALVAVVPVTRRWRETRLPWFFHPITRTVLILVALLSVVGVLRVSKPQSIYTSEEARSRLHQIYDEKMQEWPVPFEDRYIETVYGSVHVVVSGAAELPPLLLLHASGVGSWSWKHNVEELSRFYRVHAIDLIGDAGKSEFRSMDHVFRSGSDQANLYAEIADSLGVSTAYVAGASEGGFIATNYALHYPERVKKLALICPMGYAGATSAVLRIMLTQYFPLAPLQDSTFAWAFSQSPALQSEFGEWFRLLMGNTSPIKVAPLPFSSEERQSLQVPVLFIFGERDNLVGDPRRAEELVQDIPSVDVAVLDAGHLAAAEEPASVNELLLEFFRP
jgi:pimeloyl-ACP methyl ester carboxylesterase